MEIHPAIRHQPDPDHPGWWTWDLADPAYAGRFNSTLGKVLVRADGPGRGICRMFPGELHLNLQDMVHGGALLTLADLSLFAGGAMAGAGVAGAVTLALDSQFLGAAKAGAPLDAEIELLRETGRLVFLRGTIVQDGALVAAFTGTLRKADRKPA
ncbi:PaaI family thioesterase [Sphingosinicella terrae]|uniref:PaaI family thioesterase n=1 Tax=Sphingosinicella terrae TaxID=2172047 RepID=UPI000E0D8C47|nr:PaaI family thioesterase [Sphingosinicella terrae]